MFLGREAFRLIKALLKKRDLVIINNNEFEAQVCKFILYNRINIVFDVGASSGKYAKLLRKYGYIGKIISFEPTEESFSSLLEASKKEKQWDCYHLAIGDRNDFAKINVSQNLDSSSLLPMLPKHLESAPQSNFIRTEVVQLRRLDTLYPIKLNSTDRVMLKVDAQGYESEVLSGAKGILPAVYMIQLELSVVPLYKGQLLYREMLDIMHNNGYSLILISPEFSDPISQYLLQFNAVFIREDKH